MNLAQRLSPNHSPAGIVKRGEIMVIRDRILQALLMGIVAIGAIAIVLAVIEEISHQNYAVAAVYVLVYSWTVALIFWRELPYPIRAGTLVILPFIMAIAEIFDTGLLGEIRFWLLTFTTMTALLLGFAPAMVATGISVLAIVGVGLGIQYQWFTIPNAANYSLGTHWALAAFMMILISVGLSAATSALIRGLQNILGKSAALASALEVEKDSLESKVEERTALIQRRLVQVRTAAEISSTVSRMSNPETLYQQVVDLVADRLNLYYVGLFLIDDIQQYAVLRAGTGEAGQTMLARGHRLQIGSGSMIGWCISNLQARIALDVGIEAVRFNNPLLPRTRSELALPIINHGIALGALTVQSDQPEAFDNDDILVLQGVADSLASAIENVRLSFELMQSIDELDNLNRTYVREAWSEVSEEKGALAFSYAPSVAQSKNNYTVDIPILLRNQMIAKLTLDTDESRLSADDMAFLDAITTQTALALENARLVEKTERRVLQEQKLNELSTRFSRVFDIEGILKTAVDELRHLPSVSEVAIELVTSEKIEPGENTPAHGNGKEKTR